MKIAFLLPLFPSLLGLSLLACAHPADADSPADPPAAITGGVAAPDSPAADANVQIGRSEPASSCVRLGDVTGSAFSAFRTLLDSYEVAGEEMKRNAAGLGADYVLEQTIGSDRREVFRQGIAYRCAGTGSSSDGTAWNEEKTSPSGAAGFLFGDAPIAAESRCQAGGFVWSAGAGYGRCTGAPVDTGVGADVAVRFCGDRLCAIVLATTPREHTSNKWIEAFARLRTVLEGKYGKPFRNDAKVPVDCRDDVLPCLDSARASVEVTWRWRGGRRITLRMGKLEDKSGDDAIRLRYEEPHDVAPKASGL